MSLDGNLFGRSGHTGFFREHLTTDYTHFRRGFEIEHQHAVSGFFRRSHFAGDFNHLAKVLPVGLRTVCGKGLIQFEGTHAKDRFGIERRLMRLVPQIIAYGCGGKHHKQQQVKHFLHGISC